MDSTGERLRSARESIGISLEEVAARLKRPVHQVQAAEENRFEVLGGGVYVRGFLRNYCKLLRLDPEEVLATLPENLQSQPAMVAEHPVHSLRVEASAKRRRVGGTVVAILAVISAATWLLVSTDHPGEEPSVQPQAFQPEEGHDVRMIDLGASTQEPTPAPTQPAVPAPLEPVPATQSTLTPTVAPIGEEAVANAVTVTLRASDRCWVYIERDGETYRDVTLFADQDWVVVVRPDDRLTVGNAGVVSIRTPSGEWIGPLGEPKKVLRRWRLVNPDGSLHLPPIPPPPPEPQASMGNVADSVQDPVLNASTSDR